jgi:hypothetical protein
MAVGNAAGVTVSGLNTALGDDAVSLRDACAGIQKRWLWIASLGADKTAQIAALAAMPGWQNTTTDPTAFWTDSNYLYAVSQFYYGQIVTPAQFNYDTGLAGARGPS